MIPDPAETPTVSVEEWGRWCGLSRSSAYAAVERGEVPVLRFGRRIVVPVAAARRQLGLNVEAPPPAEAGAPALSLIRATNEERRRGSG